MRIVIKIGTSTITHPTGRLNIRQMEALCKVLSDLKNAGNEVILVSSGAIGMGVGKLRLGKKPTDVPTKQAAAAVGQCELMYTYDKLFSEYRHTVAQILLTADDIADPVRHENFQNTIQRLLELDAIPIVNENDTVSVAEFGIGDNDTLSAIVATSVHADLLVLLSDIDGLYTADPHKDPDAARIELVPEITDSVRKLQRHFHFGAASESCRGQPQHRLLPCAPAGRICPVGQGGGVDRPCGEAPAKENGTVSLCFEAYGAEAKRTRRFTAKAAHGAV